MSLVAECLIVSGVADIIPLSMGAAVALKVADSMPLKLKELKAIREADAFFTYSSSF